MSLPVHRLLLYILCNSIATLSPSRARFGRVRDVSFGSPSRHIRSEADSRSEQRLYALSYAYQPREVSNGTSSICCSMSASTAIRGGVLGQSRRIKQLRLRCVPPRAFDLEPGRAAVLGGRSPRPDRHQRDRSVSNGTSSICCSMSASTAIRGGVLGQSRRIKQLRSTGPSLPILGAVA
jgi:hypothetical protein